MSTTMTIDTRDFIAPPVIHIPDNHHPVSTNMGNTTEKTPVSSVNIELPDNSFDMKQTCGAAEQLFAKEYDTIAQVLLNYTIRTMKLHLLQACVVTTDSEKRSFQNIINQMSLDTLRTIRPMYNVTLYRKMLGPVFLETCKLKQSSCNHQKRNFYEHVRLQEFLLYKTMMSRQHHLVHTQLRSISLQVQAILNKVSYPPPNTDTTISKILTPESLLTYVNTVQPVRDYTRQYTPEDIKLQFILPEVDCSEHILMYCQLLKKIQTVFTVCRKSYHTADRVIDTTYQPNFAKISATMARLQCTHSGIDDYSTLKRCMEYMVLLNKSYATLPSYLFYATEHAIY